MLKFLQAKTSRKLIFTFIWIGIWCIAAGVVSNDILLPSPLKVADNFITLLQDKSFIIIISSTLLRVVVSFIISLLSAVVIAGISCSFSIFEDFIYPLISVFKSVPTMALIIILLIWLDKETAPYITGVIISFPILYENIMSSIKCIDKDIIDMADIYNVTLKKRIIDIYIPSVTFSVHGILSSTICLVLKVVVAGEIYGQPKYGIGVSLQLEKMYFNTTAIISWIMIVAVICLLITFLSRILGKVLYRWKR